jgi:hypothetical protein
MIFLSESLSARPTTCSTIGIVVDVQLADRHPTVVIRRQLVDRRAQPLTGTAPLRPEIDQDRGRRLDDGLIEIRIGERLHFLGCH